MSIALPTAPRKAREEGFNQDRVPREAPFTAYIANLSYETQTEDVYKFFEHLLIKSIYDLFLFYFKDTYSC